MTEKELRKLRRIDLLNIMLAQSQELDSWKEKTDKAEFALEEEKAMSQKLKGEIEDRDTLIGSFQEKMSEVDEQTNEAKRAAGQMAITINGLRAQLEEKSAELLAVKGELANLKREKGKR